VLVPESGRCQRVIPLEESIAATPNGPKIGAAAPQDPYLPGVVEALHGRVAARLPLRNEDKMDAEEKMQPDDPGEAVAIAAASRRGHLVVHLSDSGKSHYQELNFVNKVQFLEINYISITNETTKTLSVFFMFELGGLPV